MPGAIVVGGIVAGAGLGVTVAAGSTAGGFIRPNVRSSNSRARASCSAVSVRAGAGVIVAAGFGIATVGGVTGGGAVTIGGGAVTAGGGVLTAGGGAVTA